MQEQVLAGAALIKVMEIFVVFRNQILLLAFLFGANFQLICLIWLLELAQVLKLVLCLLDSLLNVWKKLELATAEFELLILLEFGVIGHQNLLIVPIRIQLNFAILVWRPTVAQQLTETIWL